MMAKDKSGDIENPTPPDGAAEEPSHSGGGGASMQTHDRSKKWKGIAPFAFLVVAVVLAITLGLTLGNDDDGTNASSATDVNTKGQGESVAGGETTTASTTFIGSSTDDLTVPQLYRAQYLRSFGPIQAQVKIIDSTVANGYSSCNDLKTDLLEALKYYASSVIADQKQQDWYSKCDPSNPGSPFWFDDIQGVAANSMALGQEESAAPAVRGQAKVKEDSFETNNQVEGVDDADIAKSDGDYVYVAYGDMLCVWKAAFGTQGVSITKMSYNTEEECNHPSSHSMPVDDTMTDDLRVDTNPCFKPKPQILSLLLEGDRLTAIVSEPNNHYWGYAENENVTQPIIDDSNKLIIRVYDVSSVPTDGSPLTLVGEKEIKGYYQAARSIGNTGYVITTAFVNTWLFAESLYRYQPEYCGLNSSEYEQLAAETALKNTESFLERMVDELQLQLDGTCSGIFQVAAMQSGDSNKTSTNGDMLGQFVRVLSFDISSDYDDQMIPTKEAAAFSSGWINHVYASQDFVGLFSVGGSYNEATGNWDPSTFILGFDISGAAPKPFSYAEVSGQPLNQYSADLYDGHLRVVTTLWEWLSTSSTSRMTNKIYVLRVPESGGEGQEMALVGESEHLGKPNESVFSVRFIGDKAYIVTYEQKGPFYIYDLSDPANPTKLGELEIPGFSSYLHPAEIDGVPMMLGVGEHINETSMQSGLKTSLFDISNPSAPKESATLIDEGAYTNAGWDSKSFRFLKLSQKLIVPKSEYTWTEKGNFDGFVVYNVASDEISPMWEIQHASSYDMYYGCWYNAYMPPRSFVFQSKLTTILSHSVISTDLGNGNQLWNMSLDEGLNKTDCSTYFWW